MLKSKQSYQKLDEVTGTTTQKKSSRKKKGI